MTQNPQTDRIMVSRGAGAHLAPGHPLAPSGFAHGPVTPAMRHAVELAARLRTGLSAAGFDVDRDFPCLRGDTTVSGEPFLTLGRLRPRVAEMLLVLLPTVL